MPLRLEDELLQAVAENRRTDVEHLLARGADPNAGLFGDHTALSIAVHNGNDEILDLLLHRGGLIACMREQHESDQRAPPARARAWETMRLIGVPFAKMLAKTTLDVNAKGEGGQSPLHHAVQHRSRDFVLLLLAHGANPNLQDAKGLTPLQHLTRKQPEEYTIAQTALDLVGDADGARYHGERGQAAWGFVARRRKNAIKRSLEEEEIFQALADHGADLWAVDDRGRTPLMTACEVGNTVLVGNILYRVGGGGQGPQLRHALGAADDAGKTALHLAAANGSLATLKVL
ncbi:ankyrin repeat-containing domain protein, partial [Mycena rebaudengoi]